MAVYNIFVKLLDGKTLTLKFTDPILTGETLKSRIHDLTQIPPIHQRLLTGTHQINSETLIPSPPPNGFLTFHLLLRLVGGKGGFGSLLRGAATKAGQKKTNNFDACRDMSGRRLRHVNAEKRLQEWKEEEPLRELEKKAEEFIRKKAKMAKKSGNGEEEKYVAKYRKDSEKCMNDVENAVKESFARSQEAKRKILPGSGSSSKRLKLWMTKNKSVESDSDGSDSDDEDSDEEEDEKSDVINVVGSKDGEGTSGCASEAGASEGETMGGSSEEENGIVGCKEFDVGEASVSEKVDMETNELAEPEMVADQEKVNVEENVCLDVEVGVSTEATNQSSDSSRPEVVERPESNDNVVEGSASVGITSVETADNSNSNKPLDFGDYNTAAEMEVLGIERLKTELQANGLKCGGTLQERAARLFLLKTTPLDKLPKKLLAKK
ncbi:hypothetical protein ACHQM5_000271 [Ranunculus cassubicifolius]